MNRQKPYTLYAMLVLAALWIVFFLCAPYIAPFDPETTSIADRLQDINSTHLLGTDQLGRDVWSRILYGGKASLGIAFTIIGISGAIGIAIGGLAGFSTPRVDRWLSRLIDLVLGFRIWLSPLLSSVLWGRALRMSLFPCALRNGRNMPVSREASYRLNATQSILPLLACRALQIYEFCGAIFCRMYCHRW